MGDSALHQAAQGGNLEFIKILAEFDADLTQKNAANQNALVLATIAHNTAPDPATKSACISLVQFLAENDLDPNAPTTTGDNALHIATRKRDIPMIATLLSLESTNVNWTNGVGDTALHIAARRCHLAIFQMLLARPEANLNLQNRAGDTPLHVAARLDHGCWDVAPLSVVAALVDGVRVRRCATGMGGRRGIWFVRSAWRGFAFNSLNATCRNTMDLTVCYKCKCRIACARLV